MVRGLLAEPAAVPQVMVSLRGREISAKLTAEFPAVLASGDNQAIVDGCDTVVLAIRPQIAEKVISPLRFRSDIGGIASGEAIELSAQSLSYAVHSLWVVGRTRNSTQSNNH
jgi:pyrroline-5-carboxylate reductase